MTSSRVLDITNLNSTPAGSAIIVTPTYCEGENIHKFIQKTAAINTDLLIVDDASPDDTERIARMTARTAGTRIVLMRRRKKLGLGTAYLDAYHYLLRKAAYPVIVQMDADFSHPHNAVKELIRNANDYGFALGSRYIPGGSTPDWPFSRKLLSYSANLYANTIFFLRFGFRIADVTSGFVAWRSDVLTDVLSYDIRSEGYAFQMETKLAAIKSGYSGKEIPICFKDRRSGASKINHRIIIEALKFPWRT